ncbi:MAG: hypothetical protein M3Y82_00050 [Verrucomicrobiota bacterium]|nr:hypothetical protein [Verrucomicrobiota bacterium]
MYADDDSQGRLTGVPDKNSDDLTWIYPKYVSALKTFICPATKNYLRPPITLTPPGGQPTVVYQDLTDNAKNPGLTNGHSYEVFGFWHSLQYLPIPKKTLKTVSSYHHKNTVSQFGFGPDTVAGPVNTWLILDADDPKGTGADYDNYPDPADNHGKDGVNVVFCDGHAEFVNQKNYLYKYELSQDGGRSSITPLYGP